MSPLATVLDAKGDGASLTAQRLGPIVGVSYVSRASSFPALPAIRHRSGCASTT